MMPHGFPGFSAMHGGSYYPGKVAEDDIMRILMKIHPQKLTHILAELSALLKQDRTRASEILSKNPNFCISMLHTFYLLGVLNIQPSQRDAGAKDAPEESTQASNETVPMNDDGGEPTLQSSSSSTKPSAGEAKPPQAPTTFDPKSAYHAPPVQASIPPQLQETLDRLSKKLNATSLKSILELPNESIDKLPAGQQEQIRFIRQHANYLVQIIQRNSV